MIQIIGIRKNPATRKAERFFKERGIDYHFVDLEERSLSPGELENVFRKIDPEDLIDTEGKEYKKLGFAYMEYDPKEEIAEHPLIIRMPLLRRKNDAVCGLREDVWKKWAAEEKE